MNDLISRSALLAEYDRAHVGEPGRARKLIEEAPAADAEPVRHGEWDDNILPFCNVCSVCHVAVDRTTCFPTISRNGVVRPKEGSLNYCPNCGAKMDGGATHD